MSAAVCKRVRVVSARITSLYRRVNGSSNTGLAAMLRLECGHHVRETGVDASSINRRIEAGRIIWRVCKECQPHA